MDSGSRVILGFCILASVVVVIWAVRRITAQQQDSKRFCPQCQRAWVPGSTYCPFCNYGAVKPKQPSNQPYLTWQGESGGSWDTPLQSPNVRIGREPDSDLRIDHLLVSRRHAHITLENGAWVLYDDDSTNGTYVNGNRVARWALREGDQTRIGPAVLTFHQPGAPVGRPTGISQPPPIFPGIVPSPQRVIQHLGQYRLIERLGGGGMASVFLALTPQGQQVAIKIFYQTDPYLVNKFYQERTIQLQHPHIVQIFDSGQIENTLYLVMEYVEGTDLRGLLVNRQPMPFNMVTPVIGQICEALQYAHDQGIIHRDIKPENIRLSPHQGVKLLDFGIAKVTAAVTITSDGMIIGTPSYMSHEQAKGETVVKSSDIYALGVILYEMLTGQVPFEGEPLDIIHKHITAVPIPPHRLNPNISPDMDRIVLKCLAKDPQKRFSSPKALADALGYRPGMPIPSFSYTPSPQDGNLASPGPVLSGPEGTIPLACFRVLRGGSGMIKVPTGGYLMRSDLNPDDYTLSRLHAQVLYQNGTCTIVDCSTHGTYVDGQHLRQGQSAQLRKGAQLHVGHCILLFEGIHTSGRGKKITPPVNGPPHKT